MGKSSPASTSIRNSTPLLYGRASEPFSTSAMLYLPGQYRAKAAWHSETRKVSLCFKVTREMILCNFHGICSQSENQDLQSCLHGLSHNMAMVSFASRNVPSGKWFLIFPGNVRNALDCLTCRLWLLPICKARVSRGSLADVRSGMSLSVEGKQRIYVALKGWWSVLMLNCSNQ